MQKLILITTLLFVIFISPVFAQAELTGQKITINSDNTAYQEGDVITITGEVEKVIPGMPISLQLFLEKTVLEIAQVPVSQDGKFYETFLATGPMWQNEGTIIIKASYGESLSTEHYVEFFKYTPGEYQIRTEVSIPNESGTFDVWYTMKGGIVNSIELNQNELALELGITMNTDGTLDIQIPRDSIDAIRQNGQDESFIVIIYAEGIDDPIQTDYTEKENNSEFRTISVPIKNGDEKIQIIGTKVIPEFGVMIQLVLIIAVITTMIFGSRTKLFSLSKT